MRIEYHPEAESEFIEAGRWYYLESGQKLVEEFYAEFFNPVRFIEEFPTVSLVETNGTRRVRLNRFPYSIVYLYNKKSEVVSIVAVMHQKRLPFYWASRI